MRKRRWLIAVLIAVSLAAAARGSSSSGGSSPLAGSSSAPGGTPVRIGLICSCPGAFGSSIVPAAQAAQAWPKTTNASGGISGNPIALTVDDDASNPGTSVTDAKALISAHVAAILDLK